MQKIVACLSQRTVLQILFVICSFAMGCKFSQPVVKNETNVPSNTSDSTFSDSLAMQNESSDSISTDSLALQNEFSDSISADSLAEQNEFSDSITEAEVETMHLSPNAVETIVDYFAEDSVEFDITNKKTLLFNNTNLLYEDIELKSHYVTIDFSKSELHAEGIIDSNEVLQGRPFFKQSDYEFNCHELDYNFTSKKGLIRNVIMQEGEGYLHGELVKKNADNSSFIRYGKYTTCNLEHPHFEIDFGKAKVTPNDKIITGPLYLRIADIPTFLALPFGFFPNTDKRVNGFLMPGLGTHGTLGYFMQGIGYYFAVKDMIDFRITANIYMQQAFGINIETDYVKRYKCNGEFKINYTLTPNGEPGTKGFHRNHNMHVIWRFQQDRKAHPTNSFSANVDFQTSGFRNNTAQISYDDYVSSATQSSISFNTSFKNRYSLGINANLSQNLATNYLGLDLPQINFNVQQFYPLRRKKIVGKLRWYEDISMQYTVNMRNELHTIDSVLFDNPAEAFKTFNSELTQNIPIKSTIKLLKYISWNNSASFSEVWNMKGVTQRWESDSIVHDTLYYGKIHRDTNYGFFATHNLTLSSDLSTTLYGMYVMKKGRVSAFRHTFMPSIGFSYSPYLNKMNYRTYYDSAKKREEEYDITSRGIGKTSAGIRFSLNNKLEMKVRQKNKDENEEEELKKVTLLESFSISTFYDFMKDSLRLDPISINGRTRLFKYIDLNLTLKLDPYSYDSSGIRTNTTELQRNNRLFRAKEMAWDVSFGLNLNKNFFKSKNKENTAETPTYGFKDWQISVNYSFHYNMLDNEYYYRYLRMDTLLFKYTHAFTNIVTVSGTLPLTSKWRLSFRSGYDFSNKQISHSEFTIERDLHCWIMRFRWIPVGRNRVFEFNFEPKASILKDLGEALKRKKQIAD